VTRFDHRADHFPRNGSLRRMLPPQDPPTQQARTCVRLRPDAALP
jgi:hypothetical protein